MDDEATAAAAAAAYLIGGRETLGCRAVVLVLVLVVGMEEEEGMVEGRAGTGGMVCDERVRVVVPGDLAEKAVFVTSSSMSIRKGVVKHHSIPNSPSGYLLSPVDSTHTHKRPKRSKTISQSGPTPNLAG